jgi:hypothetical protein
MVLSQQGAFLVATVLELRPPRRRSSATALGAFAPSGNRALRGDELKLARVWNDESAKGSMPAIFLPLLSAPKPEAGDDRFLRREWPLPYSAKAAVSMRTADMNLEGPQGRDEGRQWAELFPSRERPTSDPSAFFMRRTDGRLRGELLLASFRTILDQADSTGENSRALCGIAGLSKTALLQCGRRPPSPSSCRVRRGSRSLRLINSTTLRR